MPYHLLLLPFPRAYSYHTQSLAGWLPPTMRSLNGARLSRSLATLYALWLCCCVSVASADYGLSVYTDPQCTVPYTGVPAVLNTQSAIVVNQSVCVAGSNFSTPWIPSPAASVQWVAYRCQISPTGSGQSLFVSTWAYSSPSGNCPYNASSPTSYLSANSSGLAFTTTRACHVFQWIQWNATSQSNAINGYLYATFTCSNVASGGGDFNAAQHRATLAHSLLAHVSLTLALTISIIALLS